MGMQENVAVALSYVFGWVSGLIIFLLEKKNRTVRFHAMQSILISVAITIAFFLIGFLGALPGIGILFGLIGWLLDIAVFIGWLLLIINAFQRRYYKLPVVGDYAERFTNQSPTSTF